MPGTGCCASRVREAFVVRQDEETYFVQDLDPEDLAAGHGAVFVGPGEGDIEGQDLVAIAGGGQGPQVVQVLHFVVQLGGDAGQGGSVIAHDGGGEDGVGRRGIERILWPDLIDVGYLAAARAG